MANSLFRDLYYRYIVAYFNEEELDKAIEVFNKRDRRFGGVK